MSNLLSSSLDFALEFTDNPQLNKTRPIRSCMYLIPFTMMTSTLKLYIATENVLSDVFLSALEFSSLLKHSY